MRREYIDTPFSITLAQSDYERANPRDVFNCVVCQKLKKISKQKHEHCMTKVTRTGNVSWTDLDDDGNIVTKIGKLPNDVVQQIGAWDVSKGEEVGAVKAKVDILPRSSSQRPGHTVKFPRGKMSKAALKRKKANEKAKTELGHR